MSKIASLDVLDRFVLRTPPSTTLGLRYDPSQPRGEDGKWTSGGGGVGGIGDDGDGLGGGATGQTDAYDEDTTAQMRAHDALEREQAAYIDRGLDSETKTVIGGYTDEQHTAQNKVLRGAPPPPLDVDEQTLMDIEYEAELITEAILDAPPLSQPITVYRGVSAGVLGKSTDDRRELIGSSFVDKGISSTSMSISTPEQFMTGADDVMLKIRVPAGGSALSVEKLTRNPGEFEVLLPPGAKFNVVDVIPGAYDIVVVEVVN